MDISKARRLIELDKEGSKILLTLWEGNKISSCVEEQEKKYCETCQCDDEICQEYIDHLKTQGYGVTEIQLGELGAAESLPKFLEERDRIVHVQPKVVRAVDVNAVVETEVIKSADIGTVEEVLGSPGELQPGEPEGSSPETS